MTSENPYQFFKPGSTYEEPRLTEEQIKLNALSFPAYSYILIGTMIERMEDKKMKHALRVDRSRMFNGYYDDEEGKFVPPTMTASQKLEVIEFATWKSNRLIEKLRSQHG